jgi:hypothetical protein
VVEAVTAHGSWTVLEELVCCSFLETGVVC